MVIFEGHLQTSLRYRVKRILVRFGLVGYGLTEVVTRVFYDGTRTPVITTVLTIILNIIICRLLMESMVLKACIIAQCHDRRRSDHHDGIPEAAQRPHFSDGFQLAVRGPSPLPSWAW